MTFRLKDSCKIFSVRNKLRLNFRFLLMQFLVFLFGAFFFQTNRVFLMTGGFCSMLRNTGNNSFVQDRFDQIKLGQVRLGQVRIGQERLGQVRLGQARLGYCLGKCVVIGVRYLGFCSMLRNTGYYGFGQLSLGEDRLRQVRLGIVWASVW